MVRDTAEPGLDCRTGDRIRAGRDPIAFSNARGALRDQPTPARIDRDTAPTGVTHPGTAQGLDPAGPGLHIRAVTARGLPAFASARPAMRDETKIWLRRAGSTGGAVLVIGETDHERVMMQAGGLAGFPPGRRHFAGERYAV